MIDALAHRKYDWELEFEDGDRIRQPRKRNWSPETPPEELGRPIYIRLIPRLVSDSIIETLVPFGAAPVCHRFRFIPSDGSAETLIFRIGWRIGRVRNMIAIDATTGKTSLVQDREG